MQRLPIEYPEIHGEFMNRNIVVKTQTIQRSKKSAAGIIRQTRKVPYVIEWELIYHEVLAISNGGSLYKIMNESVNKTFNFISERRNLYLATQHVKLYHLTTGQCVNEMGSKKPLEPHVQHGGKSNIEFRNERFVDMTKVLSDGIQKGFIVIA